jgi:iron(III) transport system substrate-binding protein
VRRPAISDSARGVGGLRWERNAMRERKLSRRDILKATTALAIGSVFPEPLNAARPEPSAVTPILIDAARKEGKVAFYTAMDLLVAERLGRVFEAKYSGVTVRVERAGSERIFQRIGQEQQSRINGVDVVCSLDPAHFLSWTRTGWLAPYVPEDLAKHFQPEYVGADGMYATACAWLSVIGYNTNLVKREDAPKSFVDLLDPKWMGKIVKAHPSYSGVIMTSTFQMVELFGWEYLQELAKQKVMQVQSSLDPPKKVALGERAVMADGNDCDLVLLKERGQPVEVVYPTEGSPLVIGASGIFRSAPNPNAARLFQSFLYTVESQQIITDSFAQRSFHTLVKEKPGRTPLSSIKLLKSDPAAVEARSDEIKARYSKIFGV